MMRFDLCPGDRVPACHNCKRAVHNALRPGMGPVIPRFNPATKEGRCGDWKHLPRADAKPEDLL